MGWVYTTCSKCGEGRAKATINDLAFGLRECACGQPWEISDEEKWQVIDDLNDKIEALDSRVDILENKGL